MAIVSGTLYGANFIPVVYIQNRYDGASQEGKESTHFIFLTFLMILMILNKMDKRIQARVLRP